MKEITKYTILKQGDKSYSAIEIENKKYLSNTGEWKQVLLPSEWEADTKTRIVKNIVWIDKDVATEKLLENPDWWVYRRDGKIQRHKEDREGFFCDKIIAATFELEGVPKIDLENEIEELAKVYTKNEENKTIKLISKYSFKDGYKANQAKWTDEDIEKAFDAARGKRPYMFDAKPSLYQWSDSSQYLQSLNSIKEITIDSNFNVINQEL